MRAAAGSARFLFLVSGVVAFLAIVVIVGGEDSVAVGAFVAIIFGAGAVNIGRIAKPLGALQLVLSAAFAAGVALTESAGLANTLAALAALVSLASVVVRVLRLDRPSPTTPPERSPAP